MNNKIILLYLLLNFNYIISESLVYNFKIAQITKDLSLNKEDNHSSFTTLIFNQYRKRYDLTQEYFIAPLFSYINSFENYCFRIDSSFGHIKQKLNKKTLYSGENIDDLLLTFSKGFKNKNNIHSISFLLGIPTHKIYSLQHPSVGYGQFSLGIQYDGLIETKQNEAFLYGARCIYFIPKNAFDLSHNNYKFTIGSLIDLLVSYRKNWDKKGVEIGYNLKFSCDAKIKPLYIELIQKLNYSRNSFFLVYKYKVMICDVLNKIFFNITYGFDNKSNSFNLKHFVSTWIFYSLEY